jgi:hypothetical protein
MADIGTGNNPFFAEGSPIFDIIYCAALLVKQPAKGLQKPVPGHTVRERLLA